MLANSLKTIEKLSHQKDFEIVENTCPIKLDQLDHGVMAKKLDSFLSPILGCKSWSIQFQNIHVVEFTNGLSYIRSLCSKYSLSYKLCISHF